MKKTIPLIFLCIAFLSTLSAEGGSSVVDSSLIENDALKFKLLSHEKRLKETKRIRLENEIREQLFSVSEDKPYITKNIDRLTRRVEDIKKEIKRNNSELESLIIDNNSSNNISIGELKNDIERQENDLKDVMDELAEDTKELNNIKDTKISIKKKKAEVSILSDDIFKLENELYDLFNRDSLENDFRLNISIAFVLLVALVIIGFYWIAIRKESIAKNIFSGEKGIQFITLFLIIIAIILFGIMGTLESRELSALLGALSGYILGKTSVPQKEEDKSEN